MQKLELFDETLDINSTGNYDLSVQVTPDDLTFCILDSIRSKYILIRSYGPDDRNSFNNNNLEEIISKDDFLRRRFKKVNILLPTPKFTLIPAPLFDPAKKDEYFNYNYTSDSDSHILINKINEPDAFIIFSASSALTGILASAFPGTSFTHHTKPLFMHLMHKKGNVGDTYIHLHAERDFFNLIIFKENTLRFCNTFIYRNISDILYYLLNTYQKLDLNQSEVLNLSGLTEKYDDLTSGLSTYIKNYRFAEPSGNFTFSYVFNETGLHNYLNLFNLPNCE